MAVALARVPDASSVDPHDETMAKVLAAAKRAPFVPMTEQERIALAEVDEDGESVSSDEFLTWLAAQAPTP